MKRNKIAVGASLVALGIGAGGLAVASPGTANRTQPAGPPQFVARCLAKPEAQRGACFAAAVGGHAPQFVARCLAKPEAQRGACFAAGVGGHAPQFVARCLAKPEAQRGACFVAAVGANPGGGGGANPTGTGGGVRGGANRTGTGGRGWVPNFVAQCLAQPEAERGACFAAAAGGANQGPPATSP